MNEDQLRRFCFFNLEQIDIELDRLTRRNKIEQACSWLDEIEEYYSKNMNELHASRLSNLNHLKDYDNISIIQDDQQKTSSVTPYFISELDKRIFRFNKLIRNQEVEQESRPKPEVPTQYNTLKDIFKDPEKSEEAIQLFNEACYEFLGTHLTSTSNEYLGSSQKSFFTQFILVLQEKSLIVPCEKKVYAQLLNRQFPNLNLSEIDPQQFRSPGKKAIEFTDVTLRRILSKLTS